MHREDHEYLYEVLFDPVIHCKEEEEDPVVNTTEPPARVPGHLPWCLMHTELVCIEGDYHVMSTWKTRKG